MSKNTNKGAGIIETLVVFFFIGAGIVLLRVLRTGTNQKVGDQDTIFELSKKITSEMVNSSAYLLHDNKILQNFVLVIILVSLIALLFSIIAFISRKKRHWLRKLTRVLSYWLSVFSLLGALFFLIFHNRFFVSDDLKSLLQNKNTEPEIILPGQPFQLSFPNTSGVESIIRNYKVLNFTINKSEASLQNDSIISFKISKAEPLDKWEEMKTNDIEVPIYPKFTMTLPSDSRLNGAIITIEASLSMKIPYFPGGGNSGYLEKNVDLNEKTIFRTATLSEFNFSNDAGKFISIIWYTVGGCLLLFIITLIFAGNSINKTLLPEVDNKSKKDLKDGEVICPHCNAITNYGKHCKCGHYIAQPKQNE